MYRFLDKSGRLLYIGKAKDLKARVSSYFTKGAELGEKTRILVDQVDKIHITIVESELESLLLEVFLIQKLKPKYNVRMADNKSYPLIRITMKDRYPVVMLARRSTDPRSRYFGPYPSASSVKYVLKILRRAFPYQSAPNHPMRRCLYNHLGLCPCPPMYDSESLRKAYRKNIKRIIMVLEGGSRGLIHELEKERDLASKHEAFEDAKEAQQKITALQTITQPFRKPFEYEVNPNLRSDIRQAELTELAHVLISRGCPVKSLHKIECYDISNISGTHTVGSLVVFINGEKESSLYRRFRMRREQTPDDFASMEELLTRRLKHTEWEFPGLVIVDGGKGQISAAKKAFAKHGLSLPLIGLAKREETIIVPQQNGVEAFQEIKLKKSSKSLQLVMRIRDEAHRFALSYHRLLRSRATTS